MTKFIAIEPSWDFNAFEPHISELAMFTHWNQLHKKYVTNLNELSKKYPNIVNYKASDVLRNPNAYFDSEEDKTKYINNMGGHLCHTLFWYCISPQGTQKKTQFFDKNRKEIEKQMKEQGVARFGSGWSWLVLNKDNSLDCYSTQNHNTPFMRLQVPLLCVDLWEHAYYLDFLGFRKEWLDTIFNFIDWSKVDFILANYLNKGIYIIDDMLTTE
jgi:Fe-Mn family superoxide dismutase